MFLSGLIKLTLIHAVYSKVYDWNANFKVSEWLEFFLPSQKFNFADITGWINFTWDWCQEAICYLCCESCICSWRALPSLNKCSHWPLWCHLFLLTFLCNCWFISPSSDFSICPDWQAKLTELYVHRKGRKVGWWGRRGGQAGEEEEEGRLVRKKRRAGWWDREWALALWLLLLAKSLTPQAAPVAPVCEGGKNWPVILIASWVALISCSVFGCKTCCLISCVLLCHGGVFLSSFRMTISHFGHSLVSKCLMH